MPESEQKVPVGTPTAKEIAPIDLTRMNNGAHFGFIQTVCERIEKETTITANPIAKAAADGLKAALKEEDVWLAVSRKSDLTEEIMAADSERDALYMGYRSAVKGFTRSSTPEKAKAATTLWNNLTAHRINSNMQLERETFLIVNLTDDCEKKYATEVQKLGLKPYVESLKAANEKVKQLLDDRNNSPPRLRCRLPLACPRGQLPRRARQRHRQVRRLHRLHERRHQALQRASPHLQKAYGRHA